MAEVPQGTDTLSIVYNETLGIFGLGVRKFASEEKSQSPSEHSTEWNYVWCSPERTHSETPSQVCIAYPCFRSLSVAVINIT